MCIFPPLFVLYILCFRLINTNESKRVCFERCFNTAGPILLIRKMKQIYINQSNNVSNFVKLKNAKALISYRPSLLKWKRIERS